MTKFRYLFAGIILLAPVLAPNPADARSRLRLPLLPYEFSYNHNYGPGPLPGTFAYYDGPATNACRQSAATYIGQDRRRHPCN